MLTLAAAAKIEVGKRSLLETIQVDIVTASLLLVHDRMQTSILKQGVIIY